MFLQMLIAWFQIYSYDYFRTTEHLFLRRLRKEKEVSAALAQQAAGQDSWPLPVDFYSICFAAHASLLRPWPLHAVTTFQFHILQISCGWINKCIYLANRI